MSEYKVTCIRKNDRLNPYERITHLAGPGWDGTQKEVISWILSKEHRFYVERPVGDIVWLEVARSRYGNLYVKTKADGDQPNNLLSLDSCK